MAKQKSREELLSEIKSLFDHVPIGLYRTTPDGKIIDANPALIQMLGFPDRQTLLEVNTNDLHVDVQRRRELQNKMEQEGTIRNVELQLQRYDGSTIWVVDNAYPVPDSEGNVYCYEGSLDDITEQKHAESKILEWKNRYEVAVQVSGHLLYDWDSSTNEVTYGGALDTLLGYLYEEMEGGLDHWIELIHPDDVEHFEKTIERLIATKEKARLEYRVRRKDGSYVHIEDSGNFITDEHGNQIRMIGFVKDIDERAQAEQFLIDEEARYRTLFTESPIVLWEEDFSDVKEYIDALSNEGIDDWREYFSANPNDLAECLQRIKILNVNMAALDFYEASSVDELIGSLESLFTEESFPVFQDEIVTLARGDSFFESEVQTVTLTGKPLYALMRVTIPKDFENTWEKVYVSALDISEMKKAEEILKHRADRMAALHAATLDLTTPAELEPILESIIARSVDLLDGSSGGMYLCDTEKRQVRCVVSYKTARDFAGTVLNYGEGAAGVVAETGQPLIIDDYRTWDRRAEIYDGDESLQAILSVPIIRQEKIQGVLHIMRETEDNKFTQDDLDLLLILANHAAIAMENARLLQQIQQHADELEERVLDRTQELRTMVNAMAGREIRMAELKDVIEKLRRQIEASGMTPIADDPLNEAL